MQIAAEVRRTWIKDKASVKHKDFRLEFTPQRAQPASPEQTVAWSKARWFAALGIGEKSQPRLPPQKPDTLDTR